MKYLVSTGFGELNIWVAPKNVRRALCLMDYILKMLEARGHKILIERDSTFVIIGEEKVLIKLAEKRKRVATQDKWSSWEFEATGRLKFQYGISWNKKEIIEGKVKLEYQLPKILALLEMHAEHEKQERIRIKEYWEQQKEKDKITQDLKKRKDCEFSRLIEYLNKAKRFHVSSILRNYAYALNDTPSTESNSVKNWILAKADWYDPLVESEDKILGPEFRKELDQIILTNSRGLFN